MSVMWEEERYRDSGIGIKGKSEGEHREVWTVGKGGGQGEKGKREKEGKE